MLLLQIAWVATCGTVRPVNDSQAVYRPSTAGSCTVTASRANAKPGTATVRVLANVVTRSAPFGFTQGSSALGGPFTLTTIPGNPATIAGQIAAMRNAGLATVLALPCGAHSNCMDTIGGVWQFSRAKWNARLAAYGTAAIKLAVAQAVADGTVVGVNLLDEPQAHATSATGGNTWGPEGTLTKARVDSLCVAARTLFPTLAVGVGHQHQLFDPAANYRSCDFIIDQWSSGYGNSTLWRDQALAFGNRSHVAILFGINGLDGGTKDLTGAWDCPQSGVGTFNNNCWLTPTQYLDAALSFIGQGCGLLTWRAGGGMETDSRYAAGYRQVADTSRKLPRKECRRW